MIVLEQNSLEIQLKNPDFPRQILEPNVQTSRTMAGNLRTVVQTPCKLIWEVDILLLSRDKITEYVDFMFAVIGEPVKMTYFEFPHIEETVMDMWIRNDPVEVVEATKTRNQSLLILEQTT